ncbi:hypothetical protein [Pseudophaeobacter leonis]|uniref:hypothetical protein n=1 Tax=Pseudophaeobacter leonis TaxID=1144477 RepID=UPI0009F522E3|nr:hypothetical protein [Pseudophaeobacter leonis]
MRAQLVDGVWTVKTPAQFCKDKNAAIPAAQLAAFGLHEVTIAERPDDHPNRIISPGPLIDVDGLPVRSWSFREKTTEVLAQEHDAAQDAGRLECRRRIFAVVDEMAQINLAAAAGAGLLSAEQMAAYIAGLEWITQMRGTWAGLVDTGADLSDDANWPAVPDAAATLAATF